MGIEPGIEGKDLIDAIPPDESLGVADHRANFGISYAGRLNVDRLDEEHVRDVVSKLVLAQEELHRYVRCWRVAAERQ